MDIIETLTDTEATLLEYVTKAQGPVLDYLAKAVDFADEKLPEARPELPVNIAELVQSQFAFLKKVLANQEKFAKNVVKTITPLTGQAPVKAVKKAA